MAKKSSLKTHKIIIGSSSFIIKGTDTNTLIKIAEVIGLEYDSMKPSAVSEQQSIIKVWKIGELHDFLETKLI